MIKYFRDKNVEHLKQKQFELISCYSPDPTLINKLTENNIKKIENQVKNTDFGNQVF